MRALMSLTDNLETMLANGNDSAMLRFGLGSAYFNEKDYQQAITHLEKCIERDNSYSSAYKLLRRAQIKLGLNERAKRTLAAGLEQSVLQGDKQTEREITVFLMKLDQR
ncbi:MAG: putative Zn-dependent protease [Porticoccus sp.]|jgi:predicted Zn-dependent protease